MNITAQGCGLILLMVLMLFYVGQHKVQLNTQKAFMGIWYASFICITLDILSIIVLTYKSFLFGWLVELVCKMYVSSLVWSIIFVVRYICADIFHEEQKLRGIQLRNMGFGVAGSLVIFVSPIEYAIENGKALYTYGLAVFCTYLFCASLLIYAWWMTVRYKQDMNPARRRATQTWMLVWILAATTQFFFNEVLLVGFACSVGVMIIYLKLENPESNIDGATGLFNKDAFDLYTKHLRNQGKTFSILCMIYGSDMREDSTLAFNNKILNEIAEYLLHIKSAIVFKNENNEILILFENNEKAKAISEKIRKRFEEPWGKEGICFVSPKWYFIPDSAVMESSDDLSSVIRIVSHVDSGVDSNDYIEVDENIMAQLYKDKEIKDLIIYALQNDCLEMYYQPIFSTEVHQFTSAEALVRIRDKKGNIVPPGVFIGVAEKTGLIMKMGEVIFEKVCRYIRDENPMQYGIKYIEVNLSVVQCGNRKLAQSFIQIMKKYDVNPAYINLEITETATLQEKHVLLENMKVLRDYGVKFSLDDFGTGQSNLNYIVDMPVDIVKFDRGMINAYFESEKAKYVMDAAMHMIQGMNLQIVAEGIETEEQFQIMRQLGINYIQGYYFSMPLCKEEFTQFMQKVSEVQ